MVYVPPQRRGFPWRLVIILLILAAIGYGIYSYFFAAPPTPPAPPPPAVTVQQVEVKDIPLVFEYPARLSGSREVEIRARVGGILLKRAYTEGQFVHRGDLLFQIDPAPYEAALAESQATYTQNEADFKRAGLLVKQKALSAREFDQAKALYGAARAQLETAKINLGFTSVRSPISGFTSEESNSEGTLVAADTTLLTHVTQLDPMYVEFAYPDSEAMMQRRAIADHSIILPSDGKLSADIVFKDGTVYDKQGVIRFTDSIISPDTGTVHARAVVANADQGIMPGQFVRVRVHGMTQVHAISVPERAIMQSPQGMFVYTIGADGNAKISPVELGLLNNGLQIVTKGLSAGDQVVTDGMIKVKPDKPVCIDTQDNPCNKQQQPAAKPDEKKDTGKAAADSGASGSGAAKASPAEEKAQEGSSAQSHADPAKPDDTSSDPAAPAKKE